MFLFHSIDRRDVGDIVCRGPLDDKAAFGDVLLGYMTNEMAVIALGLDGMAIVSIAQLVPESELITSRDGDVTETGVLVKAPQEEGCLAKDKHRRSNEIHPNVHTTIVDT